MTACENESTAEVVRSVKYNSCNSKENSNINLSNASLEARLDAQLP